MVSGSSILWEKLSWMPQAQSVSSVSLGCSQAIDWGRDLISRLKLEGGDLFPAFMVIGYWQVLVPSNIGVSPQGIQEREGDRERKRAERMREDRGWERERDRTEK